MDILTDRAPHVRTGQSVLALSQLHATRTRCATCSSWCSLCRLLIRACNPMLGPFFFSFFPPTTAGPGWDRALSQDLPRGWVLEGYSDVISFFGPFHTCVGATHHPRSPVPARAVTCDTCTLVGAMADWVLTDACDPMFLPCLSQARTTSLIAGLSRWWRTPRSWSSAARAAVAPRRAPSTAASTSARSRTARCRCWSVRCVPMAWA